MHQRKVQGFCGKTAKILALEQRIIALKALACKGFCVVQYTLFMNDRITQTPQVDLSETFCTDIIGQTIQSVSFDHKTVVKGTTHYGQPTIIIELSNGKKLKFSHNFGELPDRESQSRFWIQ